jgi:hypothetical protein
VCVCLLAADRKTAQEKHKWKRAECDHVEKKRHSYPTQENTITESRCEGGAESILLKRGCPVGRWFVNRVTSLQFLQMDSKRGKITLPVYELSASQKEFCVMQFMPSSRYFQNQFFCKYSDSKLNWECDAEYAASVSKAYGPSSSRSHQETKTSLWIKLPGQ